jgi:hypothetical protein
LILFSQFELVMFRGGSYRGGGRHGGFGGRGGMVEDALPHSPRLHFYGAIGLPFGNRTRGSIPNVVRFIPFVNIFFTTHEEFLNLLTYNTAYQQY